MNLHAVQLMGWAYGLLDYLIWMIGGYFVVRMAVRDAIDSSHLARRRSTPPPHVAHLPDMRAD